MDLEKLSEVERNEIVVYGSERGGIIFGSIIVTLILGIIMGIFFQSLLFFMSFSALRRYAGGYHSKTQNKCFILSFVILIISLLFIKYLIQCRNVVLIIAGVSCILIWLLAPVGNRNKLLGKIEQVIYKNKTRKILILESLILVVVYLLGIHSVFMAMATSIIVTCILVVSGTKQNVRYKKLRIKL